MKRDLDLIRTILLTIEDHPHGYAPDLTINGHSKEEVGYHAYLLINAGLAEGENMGGFSSPSPEAQIYKLTWAGHEFAEAARDDTRWKKAMGIVKDKGGSVTMDVLKDLLTSLMKAAIGLP
jgi:hypothetical protein